MTKENVMAELKASSEKAKPGKRLIRVVLAMVLFVIIGQASNAVSLPACERAVLKTFIHGWAHDRPLRFNQDGHYSSVLFTRLNEMEAKYETATKEEIRQKPYPTCNMEQAVPVFPFIAAVQFEEFTSDVAGWGGRVYVANFFGLSVVFWGIKDWTA